MFKTNHSLHLLLLILTLSSCVGAKRLAREQKANIVVERARSYLGTPYRYGGTTVLGMDCSGLLMRSFEAIDVYIPRTAKAQSKMGKRVHLDELNKGDLVFFAAKKGKRKSNPCRPGNGCHSIQHYVYSCL